MSKYLITGVQGFVGRYFVEYLLSHEPEAKIFGVDIAQTCDMPINSLEFFINSFNFCRGKRGVFLCTATECRRGWQRKATGCQGLWRRVSEAAGSCGEPCADGPRR